MPKIDPETAEIRVGSGYPPPHDTPCAGRRRWRLGDAAGLTQFGVNLLRLPPGQWSSQRHWHTAEDEFVCVLEGEVVLIDNTGETLLRAGDVAGFPKGEPNGHHLQNRGEREAVLLEVGGREPLLDGCEYPDIDMVAHPGEDGYRRRNGEPYPAG